MNPLVVIKVAKVAIAVGSYVALLLEQKKELAESNKVYIDDIIANTPNVRYNFGLYMSLVNQYGVDVADRCLWLKRSDLEDNSFKFFLMSGLL